MKKLVE